MRKVYIYLSLLAAVAFSSCSNEAETGDFSSDVAKLKVEVQNPTTRAAIDNQYFSYGDSVGIILSGYNDTYKNVPSVADYFSLVLCDDVTLTSERTEVKAFYPYQRDSIHSVFSLNAESQTNYLYGICKEEIYNRNPIAVIDFKHIMARVRFEITYKSSVELEKLQLTGNGIYKKARFNIEDGTIHNLSNPATAEDNLDVSLEDSYHGYYQAKKTVDVLLIPSAIGDAQLHLRFTNGKEFDIDITLPDLEQGSYYKYPITIREDPYNSRNYVDLGLSVKWAECNLGAVNPEDSGDYYAWGEVTPKGDYSSATYKWGNGSATFADFDNPGFYTKYNTKSSYGNEGFVDYKTELNKSEDDPAYIAYRGYWRLPTPEEAQELVDKCKWTWTERGGKYGFLVESNVNGNSIFLPAAGTMVGNTLYAYGTYGFYSTSKLDADNPHYVYELSFYNTEWGGMAYVVGNGMRYYGRSIRPVAK